MSSPEELYGKEFRGVDAWPNFYVAGKPDYYVVGNLEAIDVIEAFAPGNVHRSHALKYLLRAGKKGPARQDLEKAMWWIRREISRLDKSATDGV